MVKEGMHMRYTLKLVPQGLVSLLWECFKEILRLHMAAVSCVGKAVATVHVLSYLQICMNG